MNHTPVYIICSPRPLVGKTLTARRARFLTRRKLGRPELARPVGAVGELFAGWRPDR